MTVERDYQAWTVAAGLALNTDAMIHKAITVGGTLSTANTAAGLLKSKGASGEHVTIGVSGIMKAVAGAAITAGRGLKAGTSGFILEITSGSIPVGVALETAASGDLFAGNFHFGAGGIAVSSW